MCREGVSQRVRRRRLRNARPAHSLVYRSLDDLLTEMMSPLDPAPRVDTALSRGKDPLPRPRDIRVRVLHRERVGHPDSPESLRHVAVVQRKHALEMPPEGDGQDSRERRRTILVSLPRPDDHLVALEVEVLHPQPQPLQQPHTGAVQQSRDELRGATQLPQQPAHLVPRQHHRCPFPPRRTHQIVQPWDFLAEDVAIKEEDRGERLALWSTPKRCAPPRDASGTR